MQQSHNNYQPKNRNEIESVRANNPIEQLIARYIELRVSGRRLVGRCPFHEDSSPSLVVYTHNQSWYCFGCDVGGDVFKFVELIEKVPFAEALQKLSSDTISTRRIAQPSPIQSAAQSLIELTEEHFTLLTAAAEVYHAAIFAQPKVLEYLARRRIDLDLIRRYRIGYATGDDLAKYFRFRGWDPDIGEDLGLIGPRGEFFRQRIVVPEIRDGKAIYLVGRKTQEYQKAKYLGIPGAPKPLYGGDLVKGAREVFVVEGPFDWLTLVSWGYASLALMGSHVKDEMVDLLADAERIYVVSHYDEAGQRVARQICEKFEDRAHVVPPLPNAKDVNELASHPRGREVFAQMVDRAGFARRDDSE